MTYKSHLCFLLAACFLVSGCGKSPGAGAVQDTVVTINNYTITHDEFETEFKASSYGMVDTPESRQNFLNTLIDRKLILQAAQQEGLDKEKNFLKAIEKFWEQSLLKIALDKKVGEIESQAVASNWDAKRAEEAKMMNDWMSELRKNARITIKDGVLTSPAAQKGGQ